jgi:phosphoribosylformylglycinamidine synthase
MAKLKVLIIRVAGTNCDKETEFAFSSLGADTFLWHLNQLKGKKNLDDFQIICIPGGFSYGDNLGAGKIFSLELILWFKESLKRFIEKGGFILGICNGFQVLVKSGILPNLDFKQKITLTQNTSAKFEDRWVYLKIEKPLIWFKDLPPIINLPVAHAEGRFLCEKEVLEEIEKKGLVALRYVDKEGKIAGYPFNPNGSLNNIAGICDESGRILGLMPHPERFIFFHQYPFWQKEKVFCFGKKIFENVIEYFK